MDNHTDSQDPLDSMNFSPVELGRVGHLRSAWIYGTEAIRAGAYGVAAIPMMLFLMVPIGLVSVLIPVLYYLLASRAFGVSASVASEQTQLLTLLLFGLLMFLCYFYTLAYVFRTYGNPLDHAMRRYAEHSLSIRAKRAIIVSADRQASKLPESGASRSSPL